MEVRTRSMMFQMCFQCVCWSQIHPMMMRTTNDENLTFSHCLHYRHHFRRHHFRQGMYFHLHLIKFEPSFTIKKRANYLNFYFLVTSFHHSHKNKTIELLRNTSIVENTRITDVQEKARDKARSFITEHSVQNHNRCTNYHHTDKLIKHNPIQTYFPVNQVMSLHVWCWVWLCLQKVQYEI